jgi:DNA-binding MarR family transcriptional regulator
MTEPDPPEEVAAELMTVLGVMYRQLRSTRAFGELTLAEISAVSRLRRYGPSTSTELAKREQISPQSMGATMAALEARGLVAGAPDPADGRRTILSLTPAGLETALAKRSFRTQQLTRAAAALSPSQRAQLRSALPALERIAEELG